jgi:hypothetical protein
MPKNRTGISYLNPPKQSPILGGKIFAARVEYTLLDNLTKPFIFDNFGEWSAIGSIIFSNLGLKSDQTLSNNFAKPLFPNLKNYPLKNEIVYIISLPTVGIEEDVTETDFYYFQSINIWNSNHHNAIPNPLNGDNIPNSQLQDYQQTEAGAVRRVTDGGTDIDLGSTFIERANIKPLQSFEGDIILEGRWGQSLRFGSTVTNSKIFNPWSNSGRNGDPITILRNDQFSDNIDAWVPQVEDINADESSIYLTSTQIIPINLISNSYKSYDKGFEPKSPLSYDDPQIILNSGRIVFNAFNDNILLSSNDSINLNTQETVNIDAVQGMNVSVGNEGEILLGSNDFSVIEPVILGDKFLADIENLANILVTLGNNFELTPMLTTDEESNSELLNIGGDIRNAAQNILNNLENYKSKVTFSK